MSLHSAIVGTDRSIRAGSLGGGSDDPPEKHPGALLSARNLLPGHRVLIVEDNYLVALEFQEALQRSGYFADEIAVSAEEAVAFCERMSPHFVLMDVRLLGGEDGIDAAVQIQRRFGIRSVFVTANDDPELRARAQAAQPFGWIAKPLTGIELIARLCGLAGIS